MMLMKYFIHLQGDSWLENSKPTSSPGVISQKEAG
jgi:hypothetical protein